MRLTFGSVVAVVEMPNVTVSPQLGAALALLSTTSTILRLLLVASGFLWAPSLLAASDDGLAYSIGRIAAWFVQLGLVLLQQRAWAAAEAHFRRAVELNPGHLLARGDLGYSLFAQGRHEEARENYARLLERRPQWARGPSPDNPPRRFRFRAAGTLW